jgi:hypothetical protein
MSQDKLVKRFIIGTFVALYVLVSLISTIHVIDFFELSNPYWLAVTLAIGFELGAAASLASLVILDRMNKGLVWALFITITLMQMQGNMFYAFTNLQGFESWSELFNLIEEEPIYQKRILSFVSGAILPLVALGFIKSLVDYIKPVKVEEELDWVAEDSSFDDLDELANAPISEQARDQLDELDNILRDEQFEQELKDWDVTLMDGLDQQEWSDYDWQEEPEDEISEDIEEPETIEQVNIVPEELEVDVEPEKLDLLRLAKQQLAQENMQQFLKEKRGGATDTV